MEDAEETLVLNYIDDDSASITIEKVESPNLSLYMPRGPNKFDENQNSRASKFFPKSILAKPKELDDIPDDEDEGKELIVILEKEVLKRSSKRASNRQPKNMDNHQFVIPNPPPVRKRGRPTKSQNVVKSNDIFPNIPQSKSRNTSSEMNRNIFVPVVKIEPADHDSYPATTHITNNSQMVTSAVEEANVKYETDVEQGRMHTEFKYESHSETEEVIKQKQALYMASLTGKSVTKISTTRKEQMFIDNFVQASEPQLRPKERRRTKGVPKLSIFKCKHCLYVGKSRGNLHRHNMLHTDPSQIIWFKCPHCPYQSKYLFQLKSHMILHKNPDEIEYHQCPYCELKTARKHNLKNHIRSMHSNLENSFKCALCPYSTISKDRLVAHMKSHSTEVFTCKLCKFVTKTQTYLDNHIKYIHGTVIKPFMCDTCSYKSKTGRELDRHYLRMHNKDQLQVHQCHLCSFNSIYKKNLDYHVRRMHGNSEGCPKFICGHCNKEFTYKSGLKVHIVRVHLNLPEDEWQKCQECKYKSKCLITLKRHIKRNHGVPRLHCDQCSFATNRLMSMKAHIDTHSKGSNGIYMCPECPYRITQGQSFIYHMKATHERLLSAKDICHYYMEEKPQID
ncbi:zinc finger protein 711-like [Anthonomus grandis grandis]|uniref:zinc finger protein 711-like n=1 Tax=Anthonomus grandis grandis TaxID=2921223 RepID=UPI002166678F|nr:zinc finger protein 711-like [Anthonomus grandis grandis]